MHPKGLPMQESTPSRANCSHITIFIFPRFDHFTHRKKSRHVGYSCGLHIYHSRFTTLAIRYSRLTINIRYSLCVTHYSILSIRYSRHSLFVTHYSTLVIRYSRLNINTRYEYSWLTVWYSQFALVIRYSVFATIYPTRNRSSGAKQVDSSKIQNTVFESRIQTLWTTREDRVKDVSASTHGRLTSC